jgi:EPS-associated MarR family transcriptional regulator
VSPQQTAHYQILHLIETKSEISQRDLAKALGVSLGKTHYLLKALLGKGLVKMDNFRRSDNKLAYAYVLTPEGIAARLELARNFLRFKESEYEALRGEIDQLKQELGNGVLPNTPEQAGAE